MGSIAIERAEREVTRIASSIKGTVGVCAIHVESGRRIAFDSESRFAMLSAYKVPIAAQYLNLVEATHSSLDQSIEVARTDISPGSGTIAALLASPGVHLSVRNLIELMLRVSDNTASDIILRLAGGPSAVTRFMRANGIADLNVERSTKALLCDFYGIEEIVEERWSVDEFNARVAGSTADTRSNARRNYLADSRDTCTPSAMASLLALIRGGKILNDAHRELLLSIMNRCETGPTRLKGALPPGTSVAHKTGTLEGCGANDAGIIQLPDELGNVAIAVMVRGAMRSLDEYERVIAQISRTAYDCFLFGGLDE
jgi:beta-lactamase class A